MNQGDAVNQMQVQQDEWVAFEGGDLEGRRPSAKCTTCRAGATTGAAGRTLCFDCHRTSLDRDRSLRHAAAFEACSSARFEENAPFESVNRPRLMMLKIDRARARVISMSGHGRFAADRRRAQIRARHQMRALPTRTITVATVRYPDAWLPFVVPAS